MALPPALTAMRCEANFRNAKNPATESLFIKLASILFSDTEDLNDSRVAGKSVWMGSGEGAPAGTLGTNIRGIYLREDAADLDTLLYGCVNGTWTAAKFAASPWYTGTVTTPAADSAAGVAAREEDNLGVGGAWVGPFTSPVVPRNASITFEAAWAGGDVTITGTNQFDAAQTETIADVAGSIVYGSKIFKTITGATNQLNGAGGVNHGATIGWGHKLGVSKAISAVGGIVTCDDADEDVVWDRTYSSFSPTNLPNGARTFRYAVIG